MSSPKVLFFSVFLIIFGLAGLCTELGFRFYDIHVLHKISNPWDYYYPENTSISGLSFYYYYFDEESPYGCDVQRNELKTFKRIISRVTEPYTNSDEYYLLWLETLDYISGKDGNEQLKKEFHKALVTAWDVNTSPDQRSDLARMIIRNLCWTDDIIEWIATEAVSNEYYRNILLARFYTLFDFGKGVAYCGCGYTSYPENYVFPKERFLEFAKNIKAGRISPLNYTNNK